MTNFYHIKTKNYEYKYPNNKTYEINPMIELYRSEQYRNLEKYFILFFINHKNNTQKKISTEKQKEKILKAFQRWISLQISINNTELDPVIPSKLSDNTYIQLENDIRNFMKNEKIDTKALIKELDIINYCNKLIDDIKIYIDKNLTTNAIVLEKRKVDNIYYIYGDNIKDLPIQDIIYDKLKLLFIKNQQFEFKFNKQLFYKLIYCLIHRYNTIFDGIRQGFMTSETFMLLRNTWNINFELFAASYAASSDNICSLFYDIEKYFGSVGNCFNLETIEGFYQCNPPLDLYITELAIEYVLDQLEKHNNNKLAFILSFPTWDWETMKKENKTPTFEDMPIYYTARDSKYMIYDHDTIGKKIIYSQYDVQSENGITNTLYNCSHLMILGTEKYREILKNMNIKELINKIGFLPKIKGGNNIDIDFPYKKNFMKSPEYYFNNITTVANDLIIKTDKPYYINNIISKIGMNNFKNMYPYIYKDLNKYVYVSDNANIYEQVNILTDYFTEEPRIKSKGYGEKYSPYEYWQINKEEIIKRLTNQNVKPTILMLRDYIYDAIQDARMGKISVYYNLYKFFDAKNVLDPSMAWFDRGIAFGKWNRGEHYMGVDPNEDLISGHKEAINTLFPEKKDKFTLLYQPFETVDIKKLGRKFDFVISSPAPFIGDVYGNEKGQSTTNYKNFNEWFLKYMFKTIQMAYKVMTINGNIGITILDRPRDNYAIVELLLLYIDAYLPKLIYKGVVGWEGKRHQIIPYWIFQKQIKINKTRQEKAINYLHTFYKDVVEGGVTAAFNRDAQLSS